MSQKTNHKDRRVKALVGGALINGTEKPSIDDAVVVFDGDSIIAVGPADSTKIPDQAELINIPGKTIIPGLINCHTHICLDGSMDSVGVLMKRSFTENVLIAAKHAEDTLQAGITTIRDLGGWQGVDIGMKKSINAGITGGPRMVVSGKLLCMTGGTAHMIGREADGPDEVRKAAREQLKAGADCIKVMATGGVLTEGSDIGACQYTVDEMRAAVEEAKKLGKHTAAHGHGTAGIKNAILAGADSIEHGSYLDGEVIDLMLEHGTTLVPTLAPGNLIIEEGFEAGIPPSLIEKAKPAAEAQMVSFKRAYEAGVHIAAGNDGGTPFNRSDNLAYELACMVNAGMSNSEALLSATSNAAELIGMACELGTVAIGKRADLVVLDADPLDDINAVQKVHLVIKNGHRVD